uniref:Uncharacterized protein n=1 Tax=Arundo donax TaxID=35708 RepID=A0A0A9CRS8_ARUDO
MNMMRPEWHANSETYPRVTSFFPEIIKIFSCNNQSDKCIQYQANAPQAPHS